MDTQLCNGFQTARMFYFSRNFDNCDETNKPKIVLSFTNKHKFCSNWKLSKLRKIAIQKSRNAFVIGQSETKYYFEYVINKDMASEEEIKKVFFSPDSNSCGIQDYIWISTQSKNSLTCSVTYIDWQTIQQLNSPFKMNECWMILAVNTISYN